MLTLVLRLIETSHECCGANILRAILCLKTIFSEQIVKQRVIMFVQTRDLVGNVSDMSCLGFVDFERICWNNL